MLILTLYQANAPTMTRCNSCSMYAYRINRINLNLFMFLTLLPLLVTKLRVGVITV